MLICVCMCACACACVYVVCVCVMEKNHSFLVFKGNDLGSSRVECTFCFNIFCCCWIFSLDMYSDLAFPNFSLVNSISWTAKVTLNSKILSFFFTLKKKEFRKINCLEISLLKKAVNKTEAELFFIITNLLLLWRNLPFMNKILLLLDYLLLFLYNSKIKWATKFIITS